MLKKSLPLAVLALIGEISAIQIARHHHHHDGALVQTKMRHGHDHKRYDEDEPDKFMAESLAEAEAEWKNKETGANFFK